MQRETRLRALLAILAVRAMAGVSSAAEPQPTTITVKGMHCAGCAKKLVKQLKEIKGVKDVKAEVENEKLIVHSTLKRGPSGRAMWEAVEKAGYEPVKIAGPGGTFEEKPKS